MLHQQIFDEPKGLGNGYDWDNGKSVNAVVAEEEGKFPASRLAKFLGTTSKVVRWSLTPCEWHHTSKYFNKTFYYSLQGADRKELGKLLLSLPKKGKGRKVVRKELFRRMVLRFREARGMGFMEKLERKAARVAALAEELRRSGEENLSLRLTDRGPYSSWEVNHHEGTLLSRVILDLDEEDLSLSNVSKLLRIERKEVNKARERREKLCEQIEALKGRWLREGISREEIEEAKAKDQATHGFLYLVSPGQKIYGHWAEKTALAISRS